MCPAVEPLLFDRELETVPSAGDPDIMELSPSALRDLVATAPSVQGELSSVPVEERLQVIEHVARLWKEKLDRGEYDRLKEEMAASTGYSPTLMETELSFVPAVLGASNSETVISGPDAVLLGWLTGRLSAAEALHLPAQPPLI